MKKRDTIGQDITPLHGALGALGAAAIISGLLGVALLVVFLT